MLGVCRGVCTVRGTRDTHSTMRLTVTSTSRAGHTRADVKADTVEPGKETMYVQMAPPKHDSSKATSSSRQHWVPARVAEVECMLDSEASAVDATAITVSAKADVYVTRAVGLLAVCDATPREVRMSVTLVASPKPRCERRPP
jgi:hypothetical protein